MDNKKLNAVEENSLNEVSGGIKVEMARSKNVDEKSKGAIYNLKAKVKADDQAKRIHKASCDDNKSNDLLKDLSLTKAAEEDKNSFR